MILLSFPCFYIVYIVWWNHRLREALCYIRGKQLQALELWEGVDESQKVYAKDEFHTEGFRGVTFRVLRDGTTEAKMASDVEGTMDQAGVDNVKVTVDGGMTFTDSV